MNDFRLVRLISVGIVLSLAAPAVAAPLVKPPFAQRDPRTRTLHGESIVDDYGWLRDANQPRTLAYLRAENAYTSAVMAPTAALQKKLYGEILSRTVETDETPPWRRGAYEYRTRVEKDKEHPIYTRRAVDAAGSPTGPERVIFDVNALVKKGGFVESDLQVPSDDGNLFAYTVDTLGHEDYTLRIRDLRTGRDLPDQIARVSSVAWAADNRTLVYSVEDAAKRSYRVFCHHLGVPSDKLVYEERDERFVVSVGRTTDDALLVLSSESHTQSEVRFVRADAPESTPTLVAAREPDQMYEIDHGKGLLYIRTNRGGRNFRVVTAPVTSPGVASWKELIPHDERIMREDFQLFSNFLVVEEREAGVQQLRVLDLATGAQHRVAFDEPARHVQLTLNFRYESPTFRFVYESPITPASYYDYDPRTRTRTLVKRQMVPGGYDANRYQVEKFDVPSAGVKIPVTVLSKKGVPRDGTAPLSINAYAAYGVVTDLDFNEARFSLLDRGVILVYVHARGGGELGKAWHDGGRMLNKMHTFEDVIAATDWLVAQRFGSPARLSLMGGSAGGLLVGAVLNMRPELYRVAVAEVPFVDVVNTMLDETIPLTVGEFEEWGNPKNVEFYRYMRRYCPYENLKRTSYPAMLVTTALNDARAPFWEAAKWVAKLRVTKTDDRPLLLRSDIESGGHGGPSGRYEQIKDEAFTYAFILTQLGATALLSAAATPASR